MTPNVSHFETDPNEEASSSTKKMADFSCIRSDDPPSRILEQKDIDSPNLPGEVSSSSKTTLDSPNRCTYSIPAAASVLTGEIPGGLHFPKAD